MFNKSNLYIILIVSIVEWVGCLIFIRDLNLEEWVLMFLVWCFFAWNLFDIFNLDQTVYIMRMIISEGNNAYRKLALFLISIFGLILVPGVVLLVGIKY